MLSYDVDCVFRRRSGSGSQLLVLLATQGQCCVTNERTGSFSQLTAARLGTFCRGAEGDAVTAQDGDERVTVAVLAVPEDAWELTLQDLEVLCVPELAAQGAALCVCGALEDDALPRSLRFDVMSVCLSESRGRARVHHVRGVWRS